MAEELKQPPPFLEVRVHRIDLDPTLLAVCAGYESGTWRYKQLASHLVRWLPEFALTQSERDSIGAHNAVELVNLAAKTIYTSPEYGKRGEIGEILLHIVLRQVYNTIPAITKFYFKDSNNDTVKGFDAVHVVATPDTLELWLGEAKFYDDVNAAIREAVKSLSEHFTTDYLRDEFAAITNKIDDAWPHADKLRHLLRPETSLDEVFDALCIPVFLAYDSPVVQGHTKDCREFQSAFEQEVLKHRGNFASKELPSHQRIHLCLLPMASKALLTDDFDGRLKLCQAIV